MAEITTFTAKQFLLTVQAARGNKSANRRLVTMKALWNWCRELVEVNPWRAIAHFPEEQYVKYIPPMEDVDRVLSLAEPWERDLLETYIHTGVRLSEILSLVWDDVDLPGRMLRLWTRKRKNSSREHRPVPIDDSLTRILERQFEQTGPSGLVFINPHTQGPLTRQQPAICNLLHRLCKQANVHRFGFHALRHYFAIKLMASGKADLMDIQQLLGHQKPTTTDTYLRSMNPNIGRLAAVIEEAVTPKTTAKTDESTKTIT